MTLLLLLAQLQLPYVDPDCAANFGCQNDLVWELMVGGQVIPLGDMTKEECEAALAEIEPQTPPFTTVGCRARLVERESS
jgi:hypothetical protein